MKTNKSVWVCFVVVGIAVVLTGFLFIKQDTRLDNLEARQATTSAQIDSLAGFGIQGIATVEWAWRIITRSDSLTQARIDSIVFQNGKDRDYLEVRIDYAWDWIQRQAKQRGSVP